MNLFFRRSIILLLFLLQGLSPLVHAHVQTDNGYNGLHIEGISILAGKSCQFASLENIGHTDAVIGMRPAIQQQNLSLTSGSKNNSIGNSYVQHLSIPHLIEKHSHFSFSAFLNKLSIYLSIIAPRAPPVNTVV